MMLNAAFCLILIFSHISPTMMTTEEDIEDNDDMIKKGVEEAGVFVMNVLDDIVSVVDHANDDVLSNGTVDK